MLEIVESHKVLHGSDPVNDIKVELTHLRHQVEFELRSKLLKLRQAYLQLRKPDKDLHLLMAESLNWVSLSSAVFFMQKPATLGELVAPNRCTVIA